MNGDGHFWSNALRDNKFDFHDAAIDGISFEDGVIRISLSGVEDHHYNSHFYSRHSPPVGSIQLQFLGVKRVSNLPPTEIWGYLQVYSTDWIEDGVYELGVCPDPYAESIGFNGFWSVRIYAERMLVVASDGV